MKTRTKKRTSKPDIINKFTGQSWVYSSTVKNQFFHPRNFLTADPPTGKFDAEGLVGSPACGDVMRIWLKINPKTEKIIKCKWRTFGCASAIAATSMMSVMVTEKDGITLEKALKLKPQDIIKRLGGLPDRKIHCSVLGDKALRAAINQWFKKTGQYKRVITEGSKIIDPHTKVTKADIEEAVLEDATTLAQVQERTKVGIGYPQCLPEVEQLIRFYKEKYEVGAKVKPLRKVMTKILEKQIEKILDRVRPYIQSHGGNAVLEKAEGKTAIIRVEGRCVNCVLADLTYNKIIGGLIREAAPEIKKIIFKKVKK